jgi:hypothetical protein
MRLVSEHAPSSTRAEPAAPSAGSANTPSPSNTSSKLASPSGRRRSAARIIVSE